MWQLSWFHSNVRWCPWPSKCRPVLLCGSCTTALEPRRAIPALGDESLEDCSAALPYLGGLANLGGRAVKRSKVLWWPVPVCPCAREIGCPCARVPVSRLCARVLVCPCARVPVSRLCARVPVCPCARVPVSRLCARVPVCPWSREGTYVVKSTDPEWAHVEHKKFEAFARSRCGNQAELVVLIPQTSTTP